MECKLNKLDSYALTGNTLEKFLIFAGGEDPHGGLMDLKGSRPTFETALLFVNELTVKKYTWYQILNLETTITTFYTLEEIV